VFETKNGGRLNLIRENNAVNIKIKGGRKNPEGVHSSNGTFKKK